jgi:RHS repeat-associated protein
MEVLRGKLWWGVSGVARLALLAAILIGTLLALPAVASATALPSTISKNTTLTAAESPYTGSPTIAAGVTLTIEPGTRLTVGKIKVDGTILAEGTASEPILFTGAKEEAAGEWEEVEFEPTAGPSVFNHVVFSYGGSTSHGEIWCYGSGVRPTIENSTFTHSAHDAIYVNASSGPHISGNRFVGIGGWAIHEVESIAAVDIHGNRVEGGGNGIYVNAGSSTVGESLAGNTITGVSGEALVFNGSNVPPDISENSLSGNPKNVIVLGSATVSKSQTWKSAGTPVRIVGKLTIAEGKTLTLGPGLVLLNPSMKVNGTILAEGTASEPILFTGAKEEAAGEWEEVEFEPTAGPSVFNHVVFSYGGSTSHGEIWCYGSGVRPTIENSTFTHSAHDAIYVNASSGPHISGNRFVGIGGWAIWVETTVKLVIEGNSFREDKEGLSYTGTGKLNAPNNDWGCSNGPAPAGCGASVTSNVEWRPAASFPEEGGHLRGKESQGGEGADPVILATGALDYSHTDFSLPSKGGEPLQFTRTYSSDSSTDTGLGTGWSQSGLSTATELASGEVLVVRPDGRQDLFKPEGSGWHAPSGVTDVLAKAEGTFRLTTLQGTVYAFDTSGRIATATDPHGLTTTFGYNAEGRLASVTDPSGQSLTFTYDSSNHITAVKDSTGREVKYGYSAAGELETVTDPLDDVTRYSYEGHLLKTITDARGDVILRNVYDSQNRISEQEDGTGGVWHMAYSPGQTTVTEPGGGERIYDFDGQDRVVSETDALGHATTISYGTHGLAESVDRPGGADSHMGYDAAGNLTSMKDAEGGESTWAYEARNHPTEYTDPDGHTWHYEWSASGDLLKETGPEGGETTYSYNAAGEPITVTNLDGHSTELGYGSLGERTSLIDPEGHEWTWGFDSRGYGTSSSQPGLKAESFERDALGDLLSRTTPEGHKTSYEYDPEGLLVKTTDPGGHAWRIERNAMERPVAYIDPSGHEAKLTWNGDLKPATTTNRDGAVIHYHYDAADQLTEEDGPEGETWGYGYGTRGERTSLTDPRGHTTDYEYDLLGRLIRTKAPLESTAEYGYDPDGRLTSFADPGGHTTKLAYDDRGLLISMERPLGQTTTYAYDPAGEPTEEITAEASLGYAHDKSGRLTSISDEAEALRSFAYEPDGRLSTATGDGSTISLGWKEDGELARIEDGRGQTVEREYDSRGDLTKFVDGAGTVSYAYDALGRMESATDPQGRTTHFSYDPEGAVTGIERPGGIDTANVWDEAGRLSETSTRRAGEAALESLAYGYNPDGDPTSVTDRAGEEATLSYDALDRLVEWNPPGPGSTGYGYDPAGNRTQAGSTTYGFNALGELTEDSTGAKYRYDGDGRLAKAEGESGTTSYSWDPLDELTGVESPSGSTSFSYDALSRLASRTSGEATRSFHYGDLGDDPILATGGEASADLIYGPGGLLIESEAGEVAKWPLLDSHGSLVATVDGSGEVESRSSYGPWGEALEGEPGELGYLGGHGRLTDPSTGIVRMGARSYDPDLGAFLSQDPVLGHTLNPVTFDPYPYVGDDPTGRYDLLGQDWFGKEAWETAEGAAGTAAEFGESAAGTAAEAPGFVAGKASEWTAPVRHAVATGAQEFVKATAPVWSGIGGGLNKANEAVSCVGTALLHPETEYECLPSVGPHKITPETFFESPPGNFPPSGPGATPVTP